MRHTIRVNGIRMHVAEAGKGAPVVLLHGYPETWYAWRNQWPDLSQDYHVIMPDLRGYGDSDKPDSRYDKRTMAEDIPQSGQSVDMLACRLRAKSGKAQDEQMLSALPPKADKEQTSRHVRFVLSAQSVDATLALNLVRLGFRSPRSRATVHWVAKPLG